LSFLSQAESCKGCLSMDEPAQPSEPPAPIRGGGDRPTGARKIGRRVAQGLYYGLVVAIGVAAVTQVSQQVFCVEPPAEPPPFATCDEGLRELLAAVERGRRAAEWAAPDGGDTDEEAALARYRAAVAPVWRHRDAVAALCTGKRRAALDAVERLRYSEEHGVRSQAGELTALRRRVRKLVGPSSAEP